MATFKILRFILVWSTISFAFCKIGPMSFPRSLLWCFWLSQRWALLVIPWKILDLRDSEKDGAATREFQLRETYWFAAGMVIIFTIFLLALYQKR